jgi:hypothetical protein
MKLFYTGPLINAELLVTMLEKHGIIAEHRAENPEEGSNDDLDRRTEVLVPEQDYPRAWQLFYAEREDEL